MFEVLEGDKLDNVPEDWFPFGRAQDAVVAIQDLHVRKVSVAHAHDDHGHGQVGGVHDGLPRVSHVGDDAVRQDQQDEVFLQGGRGGGKEVNEEDESLGVFEANLEKKTLIHMGAVEKKEEFN